MSASHGTNPMGADTNTTPVETVPSKPRRVRTGCLTCRERHLKCDEAQPICQNCRKSNRQCKRGVRLNFIDTQVKLPPTMAPVHDWSVHFHDESREIASEYRGGLAKYGALEDSDPPYHVDNALLFDFSGPVPHPNQHQALPPIHGMLPDPYAEDQMPMSHDRQPREPSHRYTHSHSDSAYSGSNMPAAAAPPPTYGPSDHSPSIDNRDYIRDPKELYYMQAFVEEVGLWMDSMDPQKHFSEQLPHHALTNNMLYNAFLACGARHLALVNPQDHSDETALQYYNTATSYLLQSLQNEKRDSVTCATTAVILNVYEVMSERYKQRMNHIKGARALIKECGWTARSTGVGAACFWLNIGMEVLSCLAKSFAVAWDPDDWGVDMDFTGPAAHQHDEIWSHRILYLVAKIANFRASKTSAESVDSPIERQSRMSEWQHLKALMDSWNRHVPRTMHPMGYVDLFKTRIGSAFPEVWLVKRTAIMARLLYHTGLVMLAQTNPLAAKSQSREMREFELENAMLICGIAAHNKDRGVASIAIRAVAIAAECLTDTQQQSEVLVVLKSISESTGWTVQFLFKELPKKWGWPASASTTASTSTSPGSAGPKPAHQLFPSPVQGQQSSSAAPAPTAPPMRVQTYPQIPMIPHQSPAMVSSATSQPPQQSPPSHPQSSPTTRQQQPPLPPPSQQQQPRNPLAVADFNMAQHPYQSHYVAPNSGIPRHGSTGYY